MIPWPLIDSVAHVLYCPLLLGRRHGRTGWRTRVHLIPGRWLGWVCDRYDVALGVDEDLLPTPGES